MPDITIGRLRGGFCVRWKDEGGRKRRYRLEARTREEAEPEAIDVYRRETFNPGSVTVTDVWTAYVDDLGDRPTAKTMGYTGKAVLPHFGAFRPDQIDAQLCRDYAAKREAAGVKQGSVHTELGHLRSAMKFGHRARMIDFAPHIWRPAKPTPKERWLTEAEMVRLLDAASAPHIRLAIHLMLATAGRAGAVLDLTWDRVDFERGSINLRLPDARTRKGRAVVPMNGGIRAALSAAYEARLSDYVIEYGGERVKSIRKGFSNAVERSGLEGISQHVIRHTAAVHMVSAGIDMAMVSQFLGHSNTAITYSTYARYAPGHMQEAADVLDFAAIRARGV